MIQYSLTFQRDTALTAMPLPAKRSMFARLVDSMMASRQRQVDREIARYLAATGSCGRLTDTIEREIEHRFLSDRAKW
jgi:hypothetical protein